MASLIGEAAPVGAWSGRGPHPLAGRTILQIVPHLEIGGAESATLEIAEALANVGARALVACDGGRLVPELQAKGGLWLPFPAQTRNPLAMVLNQAKLADLIWRERVAVIHAHSRAPAWVAYGATRRTRTPFVTTFHGVYSGTGAFKRNYNAVMAKGDIVIANSAFTGQHIAAVYPDAVARTRIIERGIDLRAFDPGAVEWSRVLNLRRAWNVAINDRVVLLPAQFLARKGQLVLIEAARLLTAAGLTGVRFILAGEDGPAGTIKEIDAAIAKAGLADVVKRTGPCEDMPAALLAASVVAVPSTQPEAFGRVAAEAQAMGTPAVVSDLGALAEIVAAPPEVDLGARTGWRVPPGDARALAAALYDVLTLGASARESLSIRARARVLSRFSITRMQAETLAAYAQLLGS
ncbi:MAG: glycosyltransferase family 4 protein [Pseudomonadota bacterium]